MPTTPRRVIIRHPKTEREYAILPADFRRRRAFAEPDGSVVTYEQAGFRIVSYEDGSPYQPPAERGKAEG
jgi:hypothetical protein